MQAVIEQVRGPNAPPLRVRPWVLPLLMSLEPFHGLDPAVQEAAKKANESWKPVETTPVFRIDRVSFRGVTFRDQPDTDFDFSLPIIVGPQAIVGYDDSRNSQHSVAHQVMLVRIASAWVIKEDRILYFYR
jgi:hypothetical protein